MTEFHLRLPATTANLGPGFDAVALALQLYLDVRAESAPAFQIEATGRNPEICGALEGNLLLDTYRAILTAQGRPIPPLYVRTHNEIPLGMGCGSSAAVRLAAVALASHFGDLAWDLDRVLAEACRLENHPDNAAACWIGGFVASALDNKQVRAVSIPPCADWYAMLVLPPQPLATVMSRSVLPESYARADVVVNLQRVALLTAAFAAGRADLLAVAMEDRVHQPYRSGVCPLLERLLPLAGREGILGVALSGAGPGVLLLATREKAETSRAALLRALNGVEPVEVLECGLESRSVVLEG